MRTVAQFLLWIFVVAQYFTDVFCVPTKFAKSDKTWGKMNVTGWKNHEQTKALMRKLIKSPDVFEKPEKKSELKKKTTVSINGNVVPIAGMSETDKTVHVTVQNTAGHPGTQPQAGVPQPVIQEVVTSPNSGQVGLSPPAQVGMSPPAQVGMSPPVQVGMSPPVQVGMSPPAQIGMSPPVQVGMSPPVQVGMSPPAQVGMSPPAYVGMSPPAQVGMSPTYTVGMPPPQSPGQPIVAQVGMSPPAQVGMSPPQPPGIVTLTPNVGSQVQPVLTSSLVPGQTLVNPQLTTTNGQVIQGNGCHTTTNSLHSGKLVHLDKNSEGQLTYKPITC